MQVFHGLKDLGGTERSAVAIGNFDGCHLGHAGLLKDMVQYAQHENLTATVLTFYPHPVEVLTPGKKLERLSTTSEKLALLEAMGVETVLVAPFTAEVSQLSPSEFFDLYLVETLRAKSVHVGFDFRFGKERAGTTAALEMFCSEKQIRLCVQPPFNRGTQKVSSSAIREFILTGQVAKANECLGRPYSMTGQVTRGEQRGRKLGFPTANLRVPVEKLLPENGVYVTEVVWQKQIFPSVSNIGIRPTFHDPAEKVRATIETHLFDFSSRLYDEFLELRFIEKLRDETRFSSKQALIQQIEKDIYSARQLFLKRALP